MGSPLQFIIFLSVAITVYTVLNYYFLRKHRFILTGKTLPALFLRLTLITVILTPVATFIFASTEQPLAAAVTGFTGYSWLAFLFLFLVVHGSADLIIFLAEKRGFVLSEQYARRVSAGAVIFNLMIILFGYYQAGDITVEKIQITSPLIEAGKSIRIVQISDVHFSPIISTRAAENIRELVAEQKPDLIVSTGDLLDRAIRNKAQVADVMRNLRAPLGKYAVTGNHEFISEIGYSVEFTESCGFELLRNRAVTPGGIINLAGVDDLTAERFGAPPSVSERDLLKSIDSSRFTVLLKHQPKVADKKDPGFDLQLSGHTHGGQIFPFTVFVKIAFPYLCGMYSVNERAMIYVNRGTGTWGPPIRFLVRPEITVVDLKGAGHGM